MSKFDVGKANAMTEQAIAIAVKGHAGQKRKDGSPYILHPLAVMNRFRDVEGYEGAYLRAAAVLHDVVEDCGITLVTIRENIGEVVAAIVDGVSRREDETYAIYIGRANDSGPLVRRVKIADVEDNLRTVHLLPDRDEARGLQKRYEWTLGVLR
jgi:(p)ppGpp synthase/HD superfamily hydrolase